MKLKNNFIPLKKLQGLQKAIGYLDMYIGDENVCVHIGQDINTVDIIN